MIKASREGLFATFTIILIVVSYIGAKVGYTVDSIPQGFSPEDPSIFGIVEWTWDSLQFMFNMITFRIDGMPYEISLIFVFISIITLLLLVQIIRGN